MTVVCRQYPLIRIVAYHFPQALNPDDDMRSRQGWADLYAFEVMRADETPLFRQLYQQLRSAILSRSLRPGTKIAIHAGAFLAARRITLCGCRRV